MHSPPLPFGPVRGIRGHVVLTVAAVATGAGLLAASPAAPAATGGAAVVRATGAPASLIAPVAPLAARRGGGFSSRPRLNPNRPVNRSRPVTRRNRESGRALRSFSRTLLRALGIAFLLSFLFGIGPGGSPLGLLLLFGLIALFVMARHRRRQVSYR